jgi:hypothetical protein
VAWPREGGGGGASTGRGEEKGGAAIRAGKRLVQADH